MTAGHDIMHRKKEFLSISTSAIALILSRDFYTSQALHRKKESLALDPRLLLCILLGPPPAHLFFLSGCVFGSLLFLIDTPSVASGY